jgi:kynurenine formamidase
MTRNSLLKSTAVAVLIAGALAATRGVRGQQPAGQAAGAGAGRGQGGGGGRGAVQAAVVSDEETLKRGFKKLHDGPQTVAEYEKIFNEIKNWGRWGKDDQFGTMNLVTDAKRKEASKLVKMGLVVSMAHTVETQKTADMDTPFELGGGGSHFSYGFHSTTQSHLDAICQFDYKGQLYNGFDIKEVKPNTGCKVEDVDHLKTGLITRGILMDIPRLKGLKYLEPGTPVYPEDFEAWEKKTGIKVGPGDAVFLRTGRWSRRAEKGPWQLYPAPPGQGEAGYHTLCAPWFKKRDVAIVGADVSNDVTPHIDVTAEVLAVTRGMPVHSLVIAALGGIIVDALDLEQLSETAARLNRWEFMVVGAPPRVTGATGSLINPVAIF